MAAAERQKPVKVKRQNSRLMRRQREQVESQLDARWRDYVRERDDWRCRRCGQKKERWSGLEVAKSPGVPFVYMGFILFVVGLVVSLYVQPLLRGKRSTGEKESS